MDRRRRDGMPTAVIFRIATPKGSSRRRPRAADWPRARRDARIDMGLVGEGVATRGAF